MIVKRVWTEAEMDVIRKHYAKGGSGRCHFYLPDRNEESIRCKAKEMGIRRNRECGKKRGMHGKWSDQEIQIMKDFYPSLDPYKLREMLPNRSIAAIYRQAQLMGLKRIEKFRIRVKPPKVEKVDEVDTGLLMTQRRVKAGEWKADIPAVRSVFDLAVAA